MWDDGGGSARACVCCRPADGPEVAPQGYADMVELLLGQGARPDPHDRRRNTPLHLAVCTSRWAVTQKLLSAGASVWAPNGANMSALQLARGKLNMVLRLRGKGTLDFDRHIEELHAVSATDQRFGGHLQALFDWPIIYL